MSEIAFRSAHELARAVREREVSCRELVEGYLSRIAALNPMVNAVVTLDAEGARRRAAEADEALARGELWGPLHGVPVTVKDSLETAGMRTTCGVRELADHVPDRDAVAVARLRGAGAVLLGKTNLPPWTMDVHTVNDVFGCTNNPWDLTRSPGGSSGGAAAALAAGLTGLEVGSDIGGSIRNPAHFCGVYGLKPSWGLVPLRGHIMGPPGSLAPTDLVVVGPLGRSADDLELGLDVLAGPDDAAAIGWRLELPPPRAAALRHYRIAAWLDDPACPVEAELVELMTAAVAAVRARGAVVDEAARPVDFTMADGVFAQLLAAPVGAALPQRTYDRLVGLADTEDSAQAARRLTQRFREWSAADEERHRLREQWARFFTEHDVLLCPVVPTAALPHDHTGDLSARTITVDGRPRPAMDQVRWAGVIGMAHLPSVVAPIGRTRAGLPLGIQIVAPYLEDRTAIDVARRLADVVGGFVPPPAL